ncbi:MAG TPA: hypothetical protein VGR50_08870, partial [Terriglobales bacterium]|nr:hypothetical protein [Terriglobales bacterium]
MKNESKNRFVTELQIIPTWAWTLAAIIFISAQLVFNLLLPKQPDAPPPWALALMGMAAGTFGSCLPLLIGYINVDAGR